MSYFKSNSRNFYDDLAGTNEPVFDFGFGKKTMFDPMSHPPTDTYNEFVRWWPGGIASAPEAYEIYNNWDAHMEQMSQDVTVIDGPVVDDDLDLEIQEPPTITPEGGPDSKVCMDTLRIETFIVKRSRQNQDSIFGPGGQCTKWHVSFETLEYVVNSRTVESCDECFTNPNFVIDSTQFENTQQELTPHLSKKEAVIVGGRGIFEDDDSHPYRSYGISVPLGVCRLADKEDYDPLIDRYPPEPERNPQNPDNDFTMKVITFQTIKYCGPRFPLHSVGDIAPGKRAWILNRRYSVPNWQQTKRCSSKQRKQMQKVVETIIACICETMKKVKADQSIGGEDAFNELMGDIAKKYADGPVNLDDVVLFDGGILTGEYTGSNYQQQIKKLQDCLTDMFTNFTLEAGADMSLLDETSFPKWPYDLSDQQAATLIRNLEQADNRYALTGKKDLANLGIKRARAIIAKHFAQQLENYVDSDFDYVCPCMDDEFYYAI